jgi:DNA-binding NarL/FixJ family response regulator
MSPGSRSVRLGVVDDHEVYRLGLRSLLARVEAVEVAWDTGSVYEAFDLCASNPVDAVLLDVNLGGPMDGLRATPMLVERHRGLRVILISGLFEERQLPEVRTVGAAGFLPKALGGEEMVQAIRALLQVSAPPGPRAGRAAASPSPPFEPLSHREIDVLREIRSGHTNREIARTLGVSTATVNKHVSSLLRKLQARNRAEAAIIAGPLLSRPPDTRG